VLVLYPQDPTQGSPFDTGTQNVLTPEFKRIAAFISDVVFQGPRRLLLDNVSGKQNTWSYCTLRLFPCSCAAACPCSPHSHVVSYAVNKRLKSLPVLGSVHASDLPIIFGGQDLTDYLIYFATCLDPNGPSVSQWPQYTTSSPQLLTLYDSPVPTNITLDAYRAEGMRFLTELSIAHPM
jgi:acetylcholinesterase